MAQIVLGIGTSHSPHLSTALKFWPLHAERDRNNPDLRFRGVSYRYDELCRLRESERIADRELGDDRWKDKYGRVERAIAALADTMADVKPDVVVIVGDDQEEMFLSDGMPAMSVFWGDAIECIPPEFGKLAPSIEASRAGNYGTKREWYPCVPDLGRHIIQSMMVDGFDVAQLTRQPEGRSVGHAFNFVWNRIMTHGKIPMVPITLNTYYPPNQPTPARCYAFGKSLARAIESWDGSQRVAVLASGGLSHFAIDEELDHRVIDGLLEKDENSLTTIPLEYLETGSSEIRNWIAVAGAVERLSPELVDYVPIHRTPAGTGTGMTFARWS